MKRLVGMLAGLALCCAAYAAQPAHSVVEAGARLTKLASGFGFTEGPACDSSGNVFFTDQPNDRILRWSANGQVTTFLQPSGRANGLCFDAKGNLWACADEHNEIWRIDRRGRHSVVVRGYEGRLLNGPNDIWAAPNGGVYITDPYYRRSYWQRGPMEQATQGVYYLAPGATALKLADGDLKQANGIIGTPDGKTLYVADIGAGKTYVYTIAGDGALKDRRLFCSMGSDGMTLDSDGNVYLTGNGVTVFDRTGNQIEHIDVPAQWTSNVCFGGPDRRLLFITAGDSVFGIRMRVRGVGSQ